MKYYLNEDSEINCDVYLDENGLLDVVPIDFEHPFGFTYQEEDDDGNITHHVWFSENESSAGFTDLATKDKVDPSQLYSTHKRKI